MSITCNIVWIGRQSPIAHIPKVEWSYDIFKTIRQKCSVCVLPSKSSIMTAIQKTLM